MEKALITVIIPVYNIEEYLGVCLDSVCGQTYKNLEILLIDDGSTDGTGQICDEYAVRDSRINVIHKSNEGQSVARNLGLDHARGDYIAFIDGDDWVTEDYLDRLFVSLQESNADIANCNFLRKKAAGDKTGQIRSGKRRIFNAEQAIENLCYLKELNCAPCAKLFKSRILRDIRFPEGCIYEDLAIIYKTYDAAERIVYCDFDGYFYFQRSGSSLKSTFHEKKLSRIFFSKEILSFIQENYPSIVGSAYCRLFWSVSGALMDIPWNYKNKEVRREIRENIHLCRGYVLRDRNCKKSIRFLAVLSYMGTGLYKTALDLYKFVIK